MNGRKQHRYLPQDTDWKWQEHHKTLWSSVTLFGTFEKVRRSPVAVKTNNLTLHFILQLLAVLWNILFIILLGSGAKTLRIAS